jgi:predicted O-methyltransferase YrrM
MEQTILDLLTELEAHGKDNDAREQDRSKKMLNLEPDTAKLISILIRAGKRTRLLEVGTSNGYSTIWLAWAMRVTHGHVTSIDFNPEKTKMADANLRRAGLVQHVTLLQGDASQIIQTLDDPFDVVFFDADRSKEPEQLQLVLPKLTPDALVLADNVNSHPQEIAPYLALIEKLGVFDHMVVPVGKGLSVAYKV